MARSIAAAFAKATVTSLSFPLRNPALLLPPPSPPLKSLSFPVLNPATGSTIAYVEDRSKDASKSIALARNAFEVGNWRDTSGVYRSKLLNRWSMLIEENKDDLAAIMTMESGKPIQESYAEIGYGISYMEFYAAEAVRPTANGGGFIVPSPFQKRDSNDSKGIAMALRQGVGVCGIITPWNFPFGMFIRKVAPAIAAGCTTVVKPSECTPLTAIAVQSLAQQAGLPDGVFEVITSDRSNSVVVGKEFCSNEDIKKISFTGSTRVGKMLMKQSSDTVKRVSLELGGNAAFIVFEDANLETAIDAAVASKFRNAGQTCVCADRFLVHESIYNEFVEKFVDAVNKLKVGDGMDGDTSVGPLITEDALLSVDEKVKEALKEGANLLTGGKVIESPGNFFEPTILGEVNRKSRIWNMETFGPVAAISQFSDDDDAISTANDTRYGLGIISILF